MDAYGEHCPLCDTPLRHKEHTDWQQGEKNAKGYYPEHYHYWYCHNCKRTWNELKE